MQCAQNDRNNKESDMYAKIFDESITIKAIKATNETNKTTSLIIEGMLLKTLKSPILVLLNLERCNLLRLYQLTMLTETKICDAMPTIVNTQKFIPHIKLRSDGFEPVSASIKNIANKQADTIAKLISEMIIKLMFLVLFIISPR